MFQKWVKYVIWIGILLLSQQTSELGMPPLTISNAAQMPSQVTFKVCPMRLVYWNCSEGTSCDPMDRWILRFSNNIDQKSFRPDMVTISPSVEGITIRQTNHEIMICCGVPEQTSYQVTISPELCDVYGQFLEQPARVTFQVGQNEPYLFLPFYGLATLNPAQKAKLPIYSCGLEAIQVQIFEVTPPDWPSFERFTTSIWDESIPDLPSPPGRLLETQQVQTQGGQVNDLKQTLFDLTHTFATGFGHRVILIQPAGIALTEPTELKQAVWVQATHLAGELIFEHSQAEVKAYSLLDGKPLAATQITLFPQATCQKTDSKGQVFYQSLNPKDETQFFVFQKGRDSLIFSQRTIVQFEDQSRLFKWSSLSNLIEISTERIARSYGSSYGVGSPEPCNSF